MSAAPGRPVVPAVSPATVFDQLLVADFNQSFQQIRHYEDRWDKLLQFSIAAVAAYIAAYTAVIGRYGMTPRVVISAGLLAGYGSVAGFFLLLALTRMRARLAFVTRHVNEIRALYVGEAPGGFRNLTGMYVDYTRPKAFETGSIHTIQMLFVSLSTAALFGLCTSAFAMNPSLAEANLVPIVSLKSFARDSAAFLALEVLVVIGYWRRADRTPSIPT